MQLKENVKLTAIGPALSHIVKVIYYNKIQFIIIMHCFIIHSLVVPLNFTAFARDATTIDLAWIIPPSATTVVNHYIIEITSQVNSQVTSYFSIETQALVIGLHPHYSYSCRVAVFTTSRHPYTSTIHVQLPQAGKP